MKYFRHRISKHLVRRSEAPGPDWVEVPGPSTPKAASGDEGTVSAPPLTEMTVAELREHAHRHGFDLGGASRKAEIIDAITASGE